MMMEAAPAAALIMPEADFLLEAQLCGSRCVNR